MQTTDPSPVRNERLAKAIRDKGWTQEDFAQKVGVTLKTVTRWLAGRRPYGKNARKVAALLGVDEAELFRGSEPVVEQALEEVVAAWPRRSDSRPEYWWDLLVAAEEQVAILGYAILHLSEMHPDLMETLVDKAASGCSVRLVLASPKAPATLARDQEEGLSGGLVARIASSLKYLRPLRDTDVQVRLQQAPMYNSIFRYDDEMLLTPHLYGAPGKLAPLFHLRRLGEKGLFDRFAQHFEDLWADSTAYRDWS